MQKLKYEQIGLAPASSIKVAVYPGDEECPGMGWHVHPEYEIVYVKNGCGTLNIGTRQLSYDNGILLFIGPDMPHTCFGNEDFEDRLEVVVQFDESFVSSRLAAFPELRRLAAFVDRSRYGLIFAPETKNNLSACFESLPNLDRGARLLSFLGCLSTMAAATDTRTLFSSPGSLPAKLKPADLQRLDCIFRVVNEGYDGELTSTSMAARVDMTTNSFCRFFKAHTGQSFTAFLNQFRLDRAKDLLRNDPQSIQEVMYACGFRDAPYFSRVFKRYVGISPSVFRETEGIS